MLQNQNSFQEKTANSKATLNNIMPNRNTHRVKYVEEDDF